MRADAPGLREIPSSAAAAARPWPKAPPSTARPIASPAPTAAQALTSNTLEPARSSCANAASGTRKAAADVNAAMASFFGFDIVNGSLCLLENFPERTYLGGLLVAFRARR